jgi:hypothetical protein
MAVEPVGDPWVKLADVLAEVAGVDPTRAFDGEAEALATSLRGVRRDWSGKPCIPWTMAAEVLESLRAEANRKRQAIEERLVEADRLRRSQIPQGIPVASLPEGVSAGLAMMLSDPELQGQRRTSVLEDALQRTGTVFHPVGPEGAP